MRAPSQDAERLAAQLGDLAARLRAADNGEVIYSKADVDKIVSDRLARERKKIRALEREADALRGRLEASESTTMVDLAESKASESSGTRGEASEARQEQRSSDPLGPILGQLDRSSQRSEERS